VYCVTKRRHRS